MTECDLWCQCEIADSEWTVVAFCRHAKGVKAVGTKCAFILHAISERGGETNNAHDLHQKPCEIIKQRTYLLKKPCVIIKQHTHLRTTIVCDKSYTQCSVPRDNNIFTAIFTVRFRINVISRMHYNFKKQCILTYKTDN